MSHHTNWRVVPWSVPDDGKPLAWGDMPTFWHDWLLIDMDIAATVQAGTTKG